MRKLRVITTTILFIAVCIACFTGCSAKYNEDEIMGKTTIDDIVSGIGDYSKRTDTDEALNVYPFIFEGCELGQCDVNCNDDGSVKYVTVNAIDTFHRT